jgi:hypothetical protein
LLYYCRLVFQFHPLRAQKQIKPEFDIATYNTQLRRCP